MTTLLDTLRPCLKAVVAFLGPGLLILGQAAMRGEPITTSLALTALGTAVVTALGVYVVPNTDTHGDHQEESVQPPEPGRHRDDT